MKNKKIMIITGEMGVGKTEFSLNYLKNKSGKKFLIDLDVINPYFRSREHDLFLKENNIKLLGSYLVSNSTLDVPAISADLKIPFFIDENLTAIYDLAGTDKGLNSLVFLEKEIQKNKKNVEFLVVINIARMNDDYVQEIKNFIEKVEKKTSLQVTGVIHNSHLMEYSTKEYFLDADKKIQEAIKPLNLEIKFRMVEKRLEIKEEEFSSEIIYIDELFGEKTW